MTRLFLDVDGVINASMAHLKWDGPLSSGMRQGYRIHWAQQMADELKALDLELWWATTWRQHAVSDIASLIDYGNPAMVLHPRLSESAPTTFPSIVWKMDAHRRLHRRDPKPFIHVDDEFHDDRWSAHEDEIKAYLAWAEENDGLVIGPDPAFGITPKHIEQMRQFIEEHPE